MFPLACLIIEQDEIAEILKNDLGAGERRRKN
jgi:hypothetical protein